MEITINTIPPIVAGRPGRLQSIGTIRAALSPDAENSNCDVSLDNGDGYFSRLFSVAPLGYWATVTDLGQTIFQGSITSVALSATCTLTLEA